MINMMYLVLTALLALNVSNEILNAFKTVNNSLNTASSMVEKKTLIFSNHSRKNRRSQNQGKAEMWMPKAMKAKELSDELYKWIDGLKEELKKESGLKTENGVEDYKEDDLDAPTRMLVEGPPSGKGMGKILFEKLKK